MESALPEHQIGGDAVTTVGEVVLGMRGRLRPKTATGDNASTIALTQVDPHGGMLLMEALAARRSSRVRTGSSPTAVACRRVVGRVRCQSGGGRTAPTAINAREI